MGNITRYTQTFTEVNENRVVGSSWTTTRVSEKGIDEQIAEWVQEHGHVIVSIHPFAEYSSTPESQLSMLRYTVVYMTQDDFKAYEGLRPANVHVPVRRGRPTQGEVSAAIKAVKEGVSRPASTPESVPAPRSIPEVKKEVEPCRHLGADPDQTLKQAEALAQDMRNALKTEQVLARVPHKVTTTPTPPIMVPNPNEGNQHPRPQLSQLSIPTRRQRKP